MRIRSIKPDFWRSGSISTLAIEDRLLFIGLWSYVDDNGVGLDRLSAIAADLFADDVELDARETFARVSRGLQHLSAAGRIARYTVAGKAYLSIVNWEEHQRIDRPNKPRYPLPTCGNAEFATPSRMSRETPATGAVEQGSSGAGEVVLASRSQVTRSRLGEAQKSTLRIVNGWEQTFPNRPPQRHIDDVTEQVQKLVDEGLPHEQIAAGLTAWSQGDSYSAKNIPTHVAKAGRPAKQATGTVRAMQTLDLVKQLEQEESDEPF